MKYTDSHSKFGWNVRHTALTVKKPWKVRLFFREHLVHIILQVILMTTIMLPSTTDASRGRVQKDTLKFAGDLLALLY